MTVQLFGFTECHNQQDRSREFSKIIKLWMKGLKEHGSPEAYINETAQLRQLQGIYLQAEAELSERSTKELEFSMMENNYEWSHIKLTPQHIMELNNV